MDSAAEERRMFTREIAQSLVGLIWRGHRRFSIRLLKHNLTSPQFAVLTYLNAHPSGCKMHELAEAILCSPPTMTGIVDRLEKAGLVTRQYDLAEDRRQAPVTLTAEGQSLQQEILLSLRKPARELFANFDNHELSTFADLLKKLLETMDGWEN